jgi:hypothetical protein
VNRIDSKFLNLALVLSLTALVAGCSQGGDAAADGAVDVTGSWELTLDSSMGPVIWKVDFEQDGAILTGVVELQTGSIDVTDASIDGEDVAFSIASGMGGHSFSLAFSGKVAGQEMSGTVSGGANEGAPWSAKRVD